jgi:histone H3/H4
MLPAAAIERIAKKCGVNRVSADAIKELQIAADEIGLELVREAAAVARHAKRKTILKEDIKLVGRKS